MAKQYSTLTKEFLQTLFDYRDGELYWKKLKISSQVKVGNKAGWSDSTGYKLVSINNESYVIHKIIFIYHHGFCPEFIDHIDNNRANNKIENLRPATVFENTQNAKRRKDNSTGVKGVNYCKRDNFYIARIQTNGKRCLLGYFKTLEDAKNEIIKARVKHHKEFANNG